MKIEHIDSNFSLQKSLGQVKGQSQKSFNDMLKNALEAANAQQLDYDSILEKHLLGDDIDLHQITFAAEKAKLTLDLTLQIRNKAIEAYQEIMRMQV